MTAAIKDRGTQDRPGNDFEVPIAAGKKIFSGTLAIANGQGFAEPGKTGVGLTVLGVALNTVDNRGGGDGATRVVVQRKRQFKFANFAGDPIGQAQVGKMAYLVDDQTIAATSDNVRSAAGIVFGIEPDGVWIEI